MFPLFKVSYFLSSSATRVTWPAALLTPSCPSSPRTAPVAEGKQGRVLCAGRLERCWKNSLQTTSHMRYLALSLLSSPATGDCLPPTFQVKARLAKMGAIAPINIFLRQEIDRMQRVISNVRSTLQDLQLAIDGTIIMSEVGVALPSHACTLLCRHIYTCFHNLYRISVMPWTVYMMPRFQRRGER